MVSGGGGAFVLAGIWSVYSMVRRKALKERFAWFFSYVQGLLETGMRTPYSSLEADSWEVLRIGPFLWAGMTAFFDERGHRMKRILAVYDVDPFYAQRFAEVANQRENIPFTVMAFTSMERLKNYVKEHQVELLLINSQVGQEEIRQLGISRVVSLTEGEGTDADYEYPSVYKYQSSAGIIREVIACYSERTKEIYSAESGTPARIIGVYSPVGRCLKTSFALTMGQLMASDRRVLYITLEDYSGMAAMTGEEYKNDLSDVLYYFGQGNFNLLRLSGIVHSIGNMDYIPASEIPGGSFSGLLLGYGGYDPAPGGRERL